MYRAGGKWYDGVYVSVLGFIVDTVGVYGRSFEDIFRNLADDWGSPIDVWPFLLRTQRLEGS